MSTCFWDNIFLSFKVHKPLILGPCELPHKNWASSVQLIRRLLETDRQTNKQILHQQYFNYHSLKNIIRFFGGNKFSMELKFSRFLKISCFYISGICALEQGREAETL